MENGTSTKMNGIEAGSKDGRSESGASIEVVLSGLRSAWKQFDVCGSQLVSGLCGRLAGCQYEAVSRDIAAILAPVFSCGESALVQGRLGDMEAAARAIIPEKQTTTSVKQAVIQCLLMFIKLQAEYHLLCSNVVSSAVDRLTSACDDPSSSDLADQVKSLNLHMPYSMTSKAKKTPTVTNSPKNQKHGLKASLFSFFERKNSPDEGKSAFYVDIDKEEVQEGDKCSDGTLSQSDSSSKHHVTEAGQSEILVDLGLDPSSAEPAEDAQTTDAVLEAKDVYVASMSGQVASQEELDSVINLLSGLTPSRNTPSNSTQGTYNSGNHGNLRVPGFPRSSYSPVHSDISEDPGLSLRSKGQRRSEGSIDVTSFSEGLNVGGQNTWPHQHRASLPVGQVMPPQITYDFATPPPGYGVGYRPSTLPPGGVAHMQSLGVGFPDPKLNRTWPVNNLAGSGSVMDTITGSWSGGQDSDELSDDSSTGDMYQGLSHHTDRHEYLPGVEAYHGEMKHHSLENLLDGRSNTWPQQPQPWSQQGQSHLPMELIGPPDHTPNYHRPISMQMSDPLSARNIWQNSGDYSSQTAIPPPRSPLT
ncbi:uncharacterized protein LOC128242751 [Mya arenaria]|uniref:uncharacterized protein LOC128242751 n=1 Tax=Mya arenaria TaxID=6604 RepID=UPI0022E10F0B|nr:uncharacterized protein LOC128242751 [Mya arenaria]XP_052815983.1 uncharacterized protein LOC128242751 [Mya arenaria]XP_052815984.1 uncharacterized protein LOC128242751 [Mya arenaria]